MDTVLRKYNEKCYYDKDSVPNAKILIEKNICDEKSGQVIFNVTGIYIIKSIIYVIFPWGYNIQDEKKDTLQLLNLFKILQNEDKLNPDECKDIEIQYEGQGRLLSIAYEIIKDYRENGYVQIYHVIERTNIGGRINWKKTVKLKNSMISEDGMPIYTNFVSRNSFVNKDALLRSLHIYVINMSIALFGFLFGIESNYVESDIEMPVERKYALHFLEKEKNNTFNTRIIKVINLMIQFFKSNQKDSDNDITAGVSTKTFYAVWELMCKKVFKDEYNQYSDKIPRPYWKDNRDNISYTQQIPDIIYRQGKTLYILDAKYYNIEKNKPGWHDLVKQYFYEMSLKVVIRDLNLTYNAMIIPGTVKNKIAFWAFSEVDHVPQFGRVLGVMLDIKTVINDFSYGCRNDYRKLLDELLNTMDFVKE